MSIKKKVAVASVAAVAGLGLVGAMTTDAAASAYGCSGFGPGVNYRGVFVTNGTFCGTVKGSGVWVDSIGGNAYNHLPGQNFCNWEVKADFYDTAGRWRDWASTGVHSGCVLTPEDYAGVHRYENPGSVVVTLKTNGNVVSQVRHAIY